ncbi:MAG: apolipoprotein N-acyltransferase, partial [Desulfamplus sp.]|nr:apolipoprotein N-acyltransferase [Desulfamplus sp.]
MINNTKITNHFISITQYFPAILSGFLLTLSFPKADLPWLAWVALVPLLLSLSLYKLDGKKAFKAGFIMGLCHFLSLIYWIVPTISIYGQLSLFLALPILLLLAAYLALYPALFSFGIRYLHNGFMPLTAALLWVALEYIRSTLL